ncbi:zinc-dependent alcohol dehydrogenase [Naumannella huperziae]
MDAATREPDGSMTPEPDGSMIRVTATAIGRVAAGSVEIPAPEAGQVLVRTRYAGICGSDTHALAGQHPLLAPPYVPGHEAVGVIASGDGAGRRVVLKPNVVCGVCVNCRAGRTNACEVLAWIGCDPTGARPGAMGEFFLAPSGNLYPVPDGVDDEQAALVECLATPVHAARIAGDLAGAGVVVLGAGTIGVLMIIAARAAGAERIVVTDPDPVKRERAVRLGADAALDALAADLGDRVRRELGGGADVLFDCVASAGSARQWPELVRRAATIAVVGVPAADLVTPMPAIQDRELRVQGCASYTEDDFAAALAMAADLPAAEIVSDRFAFADAATAFDRAVEPGAGKVLIGPGAGS